MREHVSSDTKAYSNFRKYMLQCEQVQAVRAAHTARLRVDAADIWTPFSDKLGTLLSDLEKREFRLRWAQELRNEEAALALVAQAESRGFNKTTRETERQAQRETAAKETEDRARRVEEMAARLEQQEREQLAAHYRHIARQKLGGAA